MRLLARSVQFATYLATLTLGVLVVLILSTIALEWEWLPVQVAGGILAALVVLIVAYVETLKRSDRLYQRSVAARLDEILDSQHVDHEIDLDKEHEPIVIFSDHHKGTRDGADDFWRAERAYCAALGWYYERGYRLVVLGDAEELWETWSPGRVIAHHAGPGKALTLESEFHAAGRYDRIWGNHDLNWRSDAAVGKHLRASGGGPFRADLTVREALKIRLKRNGEERGVALLVHGHQGTADSEVITRVSRPVVRIFGFFQRRVKVGWNTPATDFDVRHRHDIAMASWAESRAAAGVILIAGHTHRPVFSNTRRPVPTDADIDRLEAAVAAAVGANERAARRADLEHARADRRWRGEGPPPEPLAAPFYFNTGCCSFADGDITGIEIVGGRIRLVRWPDECGRLQPMQLGAADLGLATVLRAVRAEAAAQTGEQVPAGAPVGTS